MDKTSDGRGVERWVNGVEGRGRAGQGGAGRALRNHHLGQGQQHVGVEVVPVQFLEDHGVGGNEGRELPDSAGYVLTRACAQPKCSRADRSEQEDGKARRKMHPSIA